MSITIDVKGETPWFTSVVAGIREQIPVATANAINRVADEAIREVKHELRTPLGFHVRQPRLVDFLFKQYKRATPSNPAAEVAIIGPKAPIYTRHVDGGVFARPGGPLDSFFLPSKVLRPTPDSVIPRALYPANLRLLPKTTARGTYLPNVRRTRRGGLQIVGKGHTFVIDQQAAGTGSTIGVFRRIGPGLRDLEPLWFYHSRINLPAQLPFDAIVDRVVDERWATDFLGMLEAGLRR